MNPSREIAVHVYNAETLVLDAVWNLKEGNLIRAKLYADRALEEAKVALQTLQHRKESKNTF